MAILLSGTIVQKERSQKLAERIRDLPCPPVLAIVQVGDRTESGEYIRFKKSFAKDIGALVRHVHLPETVAEDEVLAELKALAADSTVSGIIIQLPLPPTLDRDRLLAAVPPQKDIDGLTEKNRSLLREGSSKAIVPATARGIAELLDFYKIAVSNKKVAVLGRSILVGSPTAALLGSRGAIVTVCHSQTQNTKEVTERSDIVIVAIGKPKLIGPEYLRAGQVVIDVGINVSFDQQLQEELPRRVVVGDVDFDAVKDIVAAISPVPGGVGPMTILALFENLVDASEKK